MKFLLTTTLLAAFAVSAVADIQVPPMAEQGPARKFGRGISNIVFGFSEIPSTFMRINDTEGNGAAFGYGVVLGVNRTLFRFGAGLYDVLSFATPTYKESYRPPYASNLIWGNLGYSEFPPEIGFDTRYGYSRVYHDY